MHYLKIKVGWPVRVLFSEEIHKAKIKKNLRYIIQRKNINSQAIFNLLNLNMHLIKKAFRLPESLYHYFFNENYL
jgi:hypothetical protein